MAKASSDYTIAEIIGMWNNQGYSENEIYRMLTAWDIAINEEMLSHINIMSTEDKGVFAKKQKHYNTLP